MINFEKRRKEFELLRMVEKIQNSNEKISMNPKIRLSGSVCSENRFYWSESRPIRAHHFRTTLKASFLTWIGFIQPLTESQSFELRMGSRPIGELV